jgi:hypothetical protein
MEGYRSKLKRRLCVFYKHADRFVHHKIEWTVCQKCQRDIRMGRITLPAILGQVVDNLQNQLLEINEQMDYYDTLHEDEK